MDAAMLINLSRTAAPSAEAAEATRVVVAAMTTVEGRLAVIAVDLATTLVLLRPILVGLAALEVQETAETAAEATTEAVTEAGMAVATEADEVPWLAATNVAFMVT